LFISANKKGISGEKLCLAEDGFEIDEDEMLSRNSECNIMILQENEVWSESLINYVTTFTPNQPLQQISSIEEINHVYTDESQLKVTDDSELNVIDESELKVTDENEFNFSSNTYDSDTNLLVPLNPNKSVVNVFKKNSTVEAFENFLVPWNKLPSSILQKLQSAEGLGKEMQTLANFLVGELRCIHPHIPAAVIRKIVGIIVKTYPDTFNVCDAGGEIVDCLSISLISKMTTRNAFLNRPPAPKIHSAQDLKIALPLKRKKKHLEATVVNFQPNILLVEDDLIEKKKMLKQLFENKSEEEELITQAMKDTFGLQRKEILINSSANVVCEEWPYLFQRKYIIQHFMSMNELDLTHFTKNFQKYAPKIIEHISQHCSVRNKNITDENPTVLCLKLLCGYFGEDDKLLIQNFQVKHTRIYFAFHV
jgi:hypothetical protein